MNYKRLTQALIISNKAQLNIDKKAIVLIEENNSNSMNVVSLLVKAKNVDINFPIILAVKGDKEGIDYMKELKNSSDLKESISLLQKKINSM